MTLPYTIERVEVTQIPSDQFERIFSHSYEKMQLDFPFKSHLNTYEERRDWYYKLFHTPRTNAKFAKGVPTRMWVYRIPEYIDEVNNPYGYILCAMRGIISEHRYLLVEGLPGKDPNGSRAWLYSPELKAVDVQWKKDMGITEMNYGTFAEDVRGNVNKFAQTYYDQDPTHEKISEVSAVCDKKHYNKETDYTHVTKTFTIRE